MAIYHFHCGIISRGKGLSAVAGSAYMACEKIKCEYDNQEHDYSRKRNHVYGNVLLPKNAPEEYRDKNILWNSVEMFEKSSNAQLSRNGDVALPKEFSLAEQIELCEGFFSKLVEMGMCVQYDIHTPDEDSGNAHAHFMLTMRGIDENGKWLPKSYKEYKCSNGIGAVKFFRPEEIPKGWKRITNKKGNFVTRNNDINGWGSKETLFDWRKTWADMCNEKLREKGIKEISHLSHAARGLDEVPQIHLGSHNSRMMKEGKINDRIEEYNEIEQLNEAIMNVKNELQVKINDILEEKSQSEEVKVMVHVSENPQEKALTQSEVNLIVEIINALKNALETILGLTKQIREISEEVEDRENKFNLKMIRFEKDRQSLENFKEYANNKILDLKMQRTEICKDLNSQYGLNIKRTRDIQPIIDDYEEYLSVHKVVPDPLQAEKDSTKTLMPGIEEKEEIMDRAEVFSTLGIKARDWGDKDIRKTKSIQSRLESVKKQTILQDTKKNLSPKTPAKKKNNGER